jgi:2'-5' RNA ligase
MRLFIAIEIPDGTKQEMAKAQEQLRRSGADAGWTRPEGTHLTLKFLGEVPEAQVEEVKMALAKTVEGKGGFRLEVAGVGVFPNARNPRVAWIGVSGDLGKLAALQASVEDAMTEIGFEREERDFTPHLTLGRIKYIRSHDAWQKALDGIKDIRLPGFDVTAVSLMKSELKRTGAVYTEIAKIELK